MSVSGQVEIYDTTLRDGTQGEGFNLSLLDKLQIAQKLDELGVDYIEGGYPLSNPKDVAFFAEMRSITLKHAKLAAFGMTRRKGIKATDDVGVRALLEAQTPVVTIVGKTSDYQVQKVLSVTLEENLQMIADTVKVMADDGRKVVYDAEHFFDGYRANPEYTLKTLRAAEEAGASVLVLCDTNGGSMPEWIAEVVAIVKKNVSAGIGIHTHNDGGVAIANALAAVRAGASHVQGTINGFGERCGNMDLIPLIANLRLKYNVPCLKTDSLRRLTQVSRFVYETANINLQSGQPYVGTSAFAHKGGMHVHAVQKDATTYEHVSPETVGNTRKILVSELSGASNIAAKAGRKFNIEQDRHTQRRILEKIQDMENDGYQFEAADATLELLIRKELGRYRRYFEPHHYRIVVLKQGTEDAISEATVKLRVVAPDGQSHPVEHHVAEGDGPINALDGALRKALEQHYPQIKDVHLTDFKVRVINSRAETAARVRVIIECRRKNAEGTTEIFGSIGVSTNIIDASWQALTDAYEHHLLLVDDARQDAQGTNAPVDPAMKVAAGTTAGK